MLKSDSDVVSRVALFRRVPVLIWVVLSAGLIAHAPLVVRQLAWLWNSEHYSFFPFVIAVFGWLAWERLRGKQIELASSLNLKSVFALSFNLAALAVATFADSIWLGWVSFLFYLRTIVGLVLAPVSAASLRGTFLILLVIIPLPLDLDTSLVIQLQKIATSQGSLLLDFFGIRHSVSGVAVRLPNKVFLVEDACSGINSLFSAVAAVTGYCAYCRLGLFRTVLNLSQTILWVLAFNALRVFLIVNSSVRWQFDLATGWPHSVLGYCFFLLILLMSLSTEQLIRHFFPPHIPEYGFVPKRKQQGTWLRVVAMWLATPFSRRNSMVAGGLFISSFALLPIANGVRAWGKPTNQAPIENFQQELNVKLGEQDLPEEIQGWRRTGFERIDREKSDEFGANSLVWTYERNGVQVLFSIDGAYREFHDLWYCYSSTGWSRRHSENLPMPANARDSGNTAFAASLQLYRGDGEQAYVVFACVDSVGQSVMPPAPAETAFRKLTNRLHSIRLLNALDNSQVVPPVIQFQAFAYTDTEFFSHERLGIQSLFIALRELANMRVFSDRSK